MALVHSNCSRRRPGLLPLDLLRPSQRLLRPLSQQLLSWCFLDKAIKKGAAALLGFAAVVEMSHFRYFSARHDPRTITTLIAAMSCLYIASEALEGSWP